MEPIETKGLTGVNVDGLVKKTREDMLEVIKTFTVDDKKKN